MANTSPKTPEPSSSRAVGHEVTHCEDSLSHVGLRQHSPDGSSVLMRLRVLPDDVKATDQALDDATVALPAGQDFCVKYPSSVVADTLAALAVCATGMVLNHALRICGLDLLPEATMHMLLGICIGILAQHRAREGGAAVGRWPVAGRLVVLPSDREKDTGLVSEN